MSESAATFQAFVVGNPIDGYDIGVKDSDGVVRRGERPYKSLDKARVAAKVMLLAERARWDQRVHEVIR